MELFDPGHFASGLGDLDAVADEDGLEVDAKDAGVESEDQSAPGAGELVQIQGRAVEELEEPVVGGRLQAQGAQDAGDAGVEVEQLPSAPVPSGALLIATDSAT